MKLLDANAALRFLLKDIPEHYEKACAFIADNEVMLRYEVIAEIAYVLTGTYGKPKSEVAEKITAFVKLDNVLIQHPAVMAFNSVRGYSVFTFDRKMNAMLI